MTLFIMPYKIIKLPHQNKYKVINKSTGKVHAYHTRYKNAIKQVRFMPMIDSRKKHSLKFSTVLLKEFQDLQNQKIEQLKGKLQV